MSRDNLVLYRRARRPGFKEALDLAGLWLRKRQVCGHLSIMLVPRFSEAVSRVKVCMCGALAWPPPILVASTEWACPAGRGGGSYRLMVDSFK